jgi:hypothetical protein
LRSDEFAYCDDDYCERYEGNVEREGGCPWERLAVAVEDRCKPVYYLVRCEDVVLVNRTTPELAINAHKYERAT